MLSTPQDIILRPVITEKSMGLIGQRKYTFKVAKEANKIQIGRAIEQIFPGAKVEAVNTMNVRGQRRRRGNQFGYTANWKKAIVTLTESSKGIEFFESMT